MNSLSEVKTIKTSEVAGSRHVPLVYFFIGGEVHAISGSWSTDLKTDAIFCSSVMINWPSGLTATKALLHPDDLDRVKQFLEMKGQSIRFRIITTYAEIKTLEGALLTFEEPDLSVIISLAIAQGQDKEYVRARRSLSWLELKNAVFQESEKYTSSGLWFCNTRSGECFYSENMYRIHRLPPHSLNEHLKTFDPFIHPEDARFVLAALETAFDQHLPLHIEYRIMNNEGETVLVRHTARWMYSPAGEHVFYGVMEDLSTHQFSDHQAGLQLEHQQAIQRSRISTLEKNHAAGLLEYNSATKKIMVSAGLSRLLGLKLLNGLTWEDIIRCIHPDDQEQVEAKLKEDITLQQVSEFSFRIIRADGRVRTIAQNGELVLQAYSQPYFIFCWKDVTTRLQHESRLSQVNTELELSTAAMEQCEEAFRTAYWIQGITSQFFKASPQLHRLFGLRQQEVLNPDILIQKFHPEDRPLLQQEIENVAGKGEGISLELRMQRRQQLLYLDCQVSRAGNSEDLVLISLQDISDKQDLHNRLQEEETITSLLSETQPGMYIICDDHFNIRRINSKAESFLEVRKEDVLQNNLLEVFPWIRTMELHDAITAALMDEKLFLLKEKFPASNHLLDVSVMPMKINGAVNGFMICFQDVTRLKQLETRLQQNMALVENLIETAADRVVVLDNHMNYIYWNSRAASYYGYPKDAVIGKNILEIFPVFSNDLSFAEFRKVLRGSTLRFHKEAEEAGKPSEQITLIPVLDEHQEASMVLLIVQEIS